MAEKPGSRDVPGKSEYGQIEKLILAVQETKIRETCKHSAY